jgi:hypothetical protein
MSLQYYGQYITCDTETDVLALTGRPGDVAFALDTKMRYQYLTTGTWFPTDALRVLRGSATVNLMATGTTKICTIAPTSFRFVALGIHAEATALTGTVVTQPTLAVGATATNYSDIAASQGLTGLLTTLGLTSTNALTLTSARAALTGSTDIFAKVNTAAIGPTAYTARFDLFGYFEV